MQSKNKNGTSGYCCIENQILQTAFFFFFSEILIFIRGHVSLLGFELLVLHHFPQLICPSSCGCWAPCDAHFASRHALQFWFHSGSVSTSKSFQNKAGTLALLFLSPWNASRSSKQWDGAFLHHPIGVSASKAASSTHHLWSIIFLHSSPLSVISKNLKKWFFFCSSF